MPTDCPLGSRLLRPAVLSAPYVLVTWSAGTFRWGWFALYALLPVAVAALLWNARVADPDQRSNWRDFLVLATLGLAVDLRWFEPAWPAHLAVFNKMLLLDAGIYGFLVIRQLDGVGFDLRLKLRDIGIGLRELLFYTPIALILGLALGFLHLHSGWPLPTQFLGAFSFTFFFIAVPEELFFRGWLQNLLERRMGRYPALFLTAALFGLSHFNKRAAPLQLALCPAGRARRHLLWACLARGTARRGLGHHSRLGRHHLVAMASVEAKDDR